MSTSGKIKIAKDGPYVVTGSVPITMATIDTNDAGDAISWGGEAEQAVSETFALCRCGESQTKPFCDGSHARVKFDGTETASREPLLKQAQLLDGPTMQLVDARVLCAYGRFCDVNGSVWDQVGESDKPETRANLIRQVGNCPSGRLVVIDKVTRKAIEPELPVSIAIVEDPSTGCSGPLWARGGIELVGADGVTYEVRNRMTLCRCGRSDNKPFCNGAHASAPPFQDGLG